MASAPASPLQLCAVMPAYNEEECITAVVSRWIEALATVVPEMRLVVVNDGSRDQTGRILDELKAREPRLVVIHQENGGHGAALYRGYREALALNPGWVFQVDSDDQFETTDFTRLWEARGSSKFLTGRRLVRHDALHRLIITRILRFLNLLLFGCFIPDVNIPFRLIEARYLTALLALIPPDTFAPNIFLAVLAARDGQNLHQIPVTHKDRQTGTVSIVRWRLIKACLRTARELMGFRLHLGSRLRELGQRGV